MGNENSQPASSATTPASEGQSVYSFGSVRRSSAASSQHSSPVEAPQPDLSHLTEDEIAQIRSVIDRAKQIQLDEATRVRQIEEDYTTYAADIVRKSSWSEIENEGKIMCPICHTTELKLNSDGTRTNQNVCKDCEEITCDECGDYAMSMPTKNHSTYEGEYASSDPQEPIPQDIEKITFESEIQPPPVGATAGAHIEPTPSQPPQPPPRRKHKKEDPARKTPIPPVRGSEAVRKEAAAHANATAASKHKQREQVKRAKSVPDSEDKDQIQRDASLPVDEEEQQQVVLPTSAVGPGNAKPDGPPPPPPPQRKQPTSSTTPVSSSKREERKARKEAEDNVDSSVVFPCQSSAGSSRLRGVLLSMVGPCGATASSSRSESECSSLISDIDWEEMSMSKYRNELTSPDEVSIASSGEEEEEEEEEEGTGIRVVRRRHRPKSLNINRSLSVTSSDDEGDEKLSRLDSEKSSKESRKPTEKASSSTKTGAKIDPEDKMKPSGSRDGPRQHSDTDPSLLQQQQPPSLQQQQHHHQQQQQQHMDYLSDGKPVRSPSPPRSPSWREGLESPPFSPRRRDSHPGKKRGHISPASPKDKKFQFSYVDTSPTVHHHHSTEDIYESNHHGLSYREDELSPPRSPLTPDELKKAFVAACGQATHRENSSRDILRKSSSSTSAAASSPPPTHQRENVRKDKEKLGLGMETEVIDLATYAATIASNTACLTSLSVSPTNIPTSNIEASELISPESITSTDSTSPISPNYYDSSQSEEVEDVELADPATKSIDYQGTKRQKQRPPSSDWSPVIDLSPIIDVSPSVEEAEQQEMLAQQQEVLLRKRESELISESEEEDEVGSSNPEKKDMDKYVIPSLRRYMNFEDISKICEGKIPDEKKLERISDMLSDFQKINRDMEILTYPVLRSNGDKEHIVTTTPPTIATRSTTSDVVTTLPIARPPSATYTMAPISTVVTTSPASTTTISITDEEEADRVLHPLPARGMRPTISTSSLSELLDSGGEDSELMTVWNLAQANVISKPTPSLQTSTSVVTATSLAMSATVVTSAGTTCTVSQADRPGGPPPPPKKPAVAPKPAPKPQPPVPAKPTDIGGAAKSGDAKPEPPPRVRRKLPETTPEIMATQKPTKPPKPARTPSTCSLLTPTTKTAPVDVVPGQPTRPLPPPPPPSKSVKMLTEAFEVRAETKPPPEIKPKPPVPEKKPPKPSVEAKPAKTLAPKAEPDKRRSREIKTKVKPSSGKEGEQQAPKVIDSPVTPPEPAVSSLKREYSDSTSVSPSSSPDHEIYTYPSPGTPPESDISPPKLQSPPSPRGESARSGKVSSRSQNDMKISRGPPYTKPNAPEAPKPKDSGKKIRRKLPPIPADEEPATTPRTPAQKKSPSSSVPPAPNRKAPTIKAVKGSPHGDNETVSLKDDSSREAGHPSQSVKSTNSSLSGVGRTNGNHSLRANGAGSGSGAGPCTSKQKPIGGSNGTTSRGGNGRNGRQPDGVSMKTPLPSNSRMGTGNDARQPGAVNGRKTSDKQAIGKHDAKPMAYSSSTVEQKVSDRRWHLHVTPPGSLSDEFTQDDNDQIIDSLVGIYGIPISTAMKSLKRRLQDELRKVTESRRRKIEELEEIHALERQIEELKLESKLDSRAAALLASGHKSRTLPRNGRGIVSSSSFDKSTAPVRSSPQIIPRRSRHRRQASDPMIAKFSPIKEDKDIEADFQARGATECMEGKFSKYSTDDSSQSGLSDTESTRSEPIGENINSAYKKIKPSAYAKMFYTGRAQSTERIHPADTAQYLSTSAPLSSSHSESYLADGLAGHLKTPTYFSDDEEKRTKEEKRQILQYEIEKRKKQLEETARLQHELIRLSRARQAVAHSYDDIPRRYAYSTSPRHVPTGIIKPLDDDLPPQLERFVQSTHDIRKSESMDAKKVQELYQAQANYSSTEYLAHKQELARRQLYDDYSTYGSYPPYDAGLTQSQVYPSSPNLMNRSDSGPVIIPNIPQGLHQPGISGSVTLPEINRSDMDIMPTRELHQHQFSSDTDNSPASDYTPAMPLLDDITTRSRKILHDIGSRPLSAEFNLPGGVDDLMNAMYRVESDNSVDADEPIMKHMMEGGVTILKQLERKKQPAPTQPKRYPFVTKRILLTRDPKDKSIKGGTRDPKDISVKGNGIGMKIVGGKHQRPDEEMVAYVAAIYPGGIAEQLHGELEEGDQILEWNGIELTGKTYEEVQQIISQPNGEIELVVRPGTKLCPKDGEGSNLQDGSCHSSYDNLEYISDDDDEYDRCMGAIQHGIDPEQLAAQLEGIRDPACTSPGDSPSGSSQQEYFLTPSMSTSACSTPHSDLTTSTSSERQRHAIDKTVIPEDNNMGDLQLQLSFDDFDNTLNVFVIQARNLLRRDFSGLSDPFVKIYLLPGRSPDHKRRTRYVSCTLNPEWHQNLVFQNLNRDDLKNKILEITVWDYDRFKPNDFLGQVVIDLNDEYFLDGAPHWYPLCQQDDNHSSTDLPKPTVGPHSLRLMSTSDIQHARKYGDFSSLPRKQVGRSHHSHQHSDRESGQEPELKRRKSLGTLPEDRLQLEKPVDISSTRSSPIPQYIQRDSHSPLINQNRSPQCNVSTSSLHQSATILRKKALQSVGGSITSDSSPEPS